MEYFSGSPPVPSVRTAGSPRERMEIFGFGLGEVPCLVIHVDRDKTRRLRLHQGPGGNEVRMHSRSEGLFSPVIMIEKWARQMIRGGQDISQSFYPDQTTAPGLLRC